MALYATNRFPGDGTTTSYEFNFVGKYINRAHVKVYQEDNVTQARTYVSINDSNFLNDTTLRGLPVTPVGSTLVIYRETPKPPMVDFVNGSRFTEYNLDLVARQGLFVAMEAMDAGGSEARQQLVDAIVAATGARDAATGARDAAVIAKNAAEAALDSFDDRYLGAKAVAPTADNDGAALLTGALYWDTSLSGMRSWNGSVWVTLPAATKASVGLDNVDNTSDANKPVSTATQTALNGKANTSHSHAVADVSGLQAELNGKQASLGFTPVQQGGGTGQNSNKVYIGWANDGSGLLCQVDVTNFGKSWPINVTGTASRVFNPYVSPAVEQNGDIGAAFVDWTGPAAPALQLNTPNSNSAYMVWRATRWGGRHVAAMHVYEGSMVVTMSVGNLNNFTWDGAGNFTATGNVTAYSDIRLKTDLTKIEGALGKVCAINGYTYTRKDTGVRQTGVVAQEVQKVLPEAVIDNGEHLAVAYGNMVGLLIEAIKELKTEVDQLKGK